MTAKKDNEKAYFYFVPILSDHTLCKTGPGSLIGVWVADKLGRRWTHAGILLADAICFFILIWIVHDPSLSPLATVLCMIVKFNISATFTVAYVQVIQQSLDLGFLDFAHSLDLEH